MPPKNPPFEYYDIGRPNLLENAEFTQEIQFLIRRKKWEFLSDSQLDENFAEWEEAGASYYLDELEQEAALESLESMYLVHAMPRIDAEDLYTTGVLSSHRYRADNPLQYPHYDRRFGYPSPIESAVGLDDYVNFVVAGSPSHSIRSETIELFVGAQASLLKKNGIVFPFGPEVYQHITPRQNQIMILQALALRTQDYIKILPKLIAAEAIGQPGAVLPNWFREHFGDIPYTNAEVKFEGCPSFRDLEFGMVDKEFKISQEQLS